jgi:hypothetical protein
LTGLAAFAANCAISSFQEIGALENHAFQGRDRHGMGGFEIGPFSLPARVFPSRPSGPVNIVLAGALGFVAGAVCWHLVGFWSFVSDAVLYRRPDAPAVQAPLRPTPGLAKTQSRPSGAAASLLTPDGNCTVAVLDRGNVTADAMVAACDPAAFKYRPSRNAVRADRGETAVGGWSARVEKPE